MTSTSTSRPPATQSQIFRAEYDDEGVYFYQAYGDDIADHALRHGRLGETQHQRLVEVPPHCPHECARQHRLGDVKNGLGLSSPRISRFSDLRFKSRLRFAI